MASATNKRALERKVAVIVDRYRCELPGRVDELRRLWRALLEAPSPQPALDHLFHAAHTLKGSAGTLGFGAVSTEAGRIDACLRPLLPSPRAPDEGECRRIEIALQRLDALLADQRAPDTMPVAEPLLEVAAEPVTQPVWLLQCGGEVDSELRAQLSHFGFEIHVAEDRDRFTALCRREQPAVVVIDMDAGTQDDGIAAANVLQAACEAPPPIVFLAERTDMQARLDAVRSGGHAYLRKPVDLSNLVEVLDRLTKGQRVEPWRILIVEDSGLLGAFYALTLEGGGMRTRVVREPLQLLDAMADFGPELVLMDLYLPDYSGAELAALIRQEPAYVGIPVVYLSSEDDLGRQLEAIGRGGDEFLTKPITPEHLLLAVRSRAERYRAVSRLMVRDSLTGLLNHSRLKEQFAIELKRARRKQTPLAFAMLDIDHFKSVNDRYGHPVGDRVIQSLARLMRQRLRATDVIGRYGGEEFAVVLENAGPEEAFRILDDLRVHFGELRHRAGSCEFQATLSCGIACFPRYDDDSALGEAADRALYAAKRGGRNQVRVADD